MQNELTLKDGSVGFLEEEAEPKTFLSIDSIEKVYINEPEGDLKDYPTFEATFKLNTRKRYYERNAYTFLELLGDFGGFNDALFMLVGLVSSFYGAQMYQAAVAQELQYNDK